VRWLASLEVFVPLWVNFDVFLHVVVGEQDLGISVERSDGWALRDVLTNQNLLAFVLVILALLDGIDLEQNFVGLGELLLDYLVEVGSLGVSRDMDLWSEFKLEWELGVFGFLCHLVKFTPVSETESEAIFGGGSELGSKCGERKLINL